MWWRSDGLPCSHREMNRIGRRTTYAMLMIVAGVLIGRAFGLL